MNYKRFVEDRVKTTPQLVVEANLALYHATLNLPHAAKHCGMTQREMKMTFREFLKTHPMCYNELIQLTLPVG